MRMFIKKNCFLKKKKFLVINKKGLLMMNYTKEGFDPKPFIPHRTSKTVVAD